MELGAAVIGDHWISRPPKTFEPSSRGSRKSLNLHFPPSTLHPNPPISGSFIRRYYLIDSQSSFQISNHLPLLLFIMVQFSEETKVSLRSGIHAILCDIDTNSVFALSIGACLQGDRYFSCCHPLVRPPACLHHQPATLSMTIPFSRTTELTLVDLIVVICL